MSISLLELGGSMGSFAKSIVFILAFMSIYSLGVDGAKWCRIRRSMKQKAKFAPEFARFLQEEQLDQAIARAEKQKISHGARVLGEALREIKPLLQDRSQVTVADSNSSERAVEGHMLIL